MNEGAHVNTPLEIILNSTLSNALLNLQKFDEVSAIFLCNASCWLCFASSCVAKPRHPFSRNQNVSPAFIVVKLDLWHRNRNACDQALRCGRSALKMLDRLDQNTDLYCTSVSLNPEYYIFLLLGNRFMKSDYRHSNNELQVTNSVAELTSGIYLTLTHAHFALHQYDEGK